MTKELIAGAAMAGRHLVLSYSGGDLICTCQEPMPGPDGGEPLVVRAAAQDPGEVTVSELEMLPAARALIEEALRRLGIYDEVVGQAAHPAP
jgi:GMP synthase PP-ATPase subunit